MTGRFLNLSSSSVRLAALVAMLLAELALVVGLRTVGWPQTAGVILNGLRWLAIAAAVVLPLGIAAVLLYRSRWRFSLRALLAVTAIVAAYCGLASALLQVPERYRPHPLSDSIRFELFAASATNPGGAQPQADPNTGKAIYLVGTPMIATADVATVQRCDDPPGTPGLAVTLTPAGAKKLSLATRTARGQQVAIAVDGQVVFAAAVYGPLSRSFMLTGGTAAKRDAIFQRLTGKP